MKRPVSLHAYRSHKEECLHRLKGRKHTKCDCPIWMDGTDENGQRVQCSMHTSNWQVAQRIIRDFEVRGFVHERVTESEATSAKITLSEARAKFLAANSNLSAARVKKYELFFRRFEELAGAKGLRRLGDLDLNFLTDLRIEWINTWKLSEGTICLYIQMLRRFYHFCQKRHFIETNDAKDLEMPTVKSRPTMPFSTDEWVRILEALPEYEKRAGQVAAHRLRAFVLLLRFSGMRIGDCVRCEPSWIDGNRISFVSQKTAVKVRNKLPAVVIETLKTLPLKNGRYFFWSGGCSHHGVIGKWQKKLQILFRLAGVQGGHAHRFRSTYAHDMALNGGMSLEEMRQALGHKTARTTERSYSHWLPDRQDRLEAKQERAWAAADAALPAL
jgi:integrase